MNPWLLTLLLSSCALAGGTEPRVLPGLTLEARLIGRTAELQIVPAVVSPDDGAYFQMFPAQTRAVLNAPGQRWKAQYDADLPPAYVSVSPVSGWLELFRSPANAQLAREQINILRVLNSGQLRLNEVRPLPFLPLRNAFQAVVGAVRRVDTPVLRGVRYLTVYSQEDGVRFPRETLFYTFQGLSQDGRFYISVQVPHAPASLPTRAELDRTGNFEVAPMPAESGGPAYDVYRRKVDAYKSDVGRRLDAEDTAAGLRALDALVRSIRLH